MKTEIRLSGAGGQGLILVGIILAESAINSKLNAIQTQSYGPEARGGASKSEVIISDCDINFPKVLNPDILLCLTQKSLNEYLKDMRSNGIIIVDKELNTENFNNVNIYKVPIINTSKEVTGSKVSSNMVALGVISNLLSQIEKEDIIKSIKKRVPKGSENKNILAFEEGKKLFNNTDI